MHSSLLVHTTAWRPERGRRRGYMVAFGRPPSIRLASHTCEGLTVRATLQWAIQSFGRSLVQLVPSGPADIQECRQSPSPELTCYSHVELSRFPALDKWGQLFEMKTRD